MAALPEPAAQCTARFSTAFPTERQAGIAVRSLAADGEPPNSCTKTITREGATLKMTLTAAEPRLLRTALGSFLDHLILVTATMEQFDPVPLPGKSCMD